MFQELIESIESKCALFLNENQISKLHDVIIECMSADRKTRPISNEGLLDSFINSKRIEGCSEKTLHYYSSTINSMFQRFDKIVTCLTTDDLRSYLSMYQNERGASKVTINNIRRILSTFYSWLEDEDYIIKSPVRRIKKVKTIKSVKQVYSDEMLEQLRDNCENIRDLSMVDLLSSTGMRVGELVNLNRMDVDLINRECVVLGKGGKERTVYFDARTKVHLSNYLNTRMDDNEALFVSLSEPHNRLEISGVETRLKKIGKDIGSGSVHPHKFRRTLATRAIDKGMPIEQVQVLLGHTKIDTTLEYAMVNQQNVKASHCKFIC
jgi:integrase/recombinase XerD